MKCVLYSGDCLDVMPSLPPGSVDLVLCDPPYGTIKGLTLDTWDKGTTVWDDALNPEDIFTQCERLLRVGGALVMFSKEPYTSRMITQAEKNLPFLYRMVWKKEHFANPFSVKKAPASFFEDIVVFRKKYDSEKRNPLREYAGRILSFTGHRTDKEVNKTLGHHRAEHFFRVNTTQFSPCSQDTYNELITRFGIDRMPGFMTYEEMRKVNSGYGTVVFNLPKGKKYRSDVLEYARERERWHPTQKPVALLEELIQTYSNPGDRVLDFTMGSGSTGVACIRTGRRFTGIEKDDRYFAVAKKRLEKENSEMVVI
ncbi:site-specific DNA-methyltransferase [Escherichia coli]|nr:site-specific DNA-methyltransferase [Escherichia coli]